MADAANHDLYDEALGLTLDNLPSTETRTISNDNCLGIEENINEEIRRLKQSKKRADRISVVKGLTTRLGLSDSVVSLKLNDMIASGNIIVNMHRGRESFFVPNRRDDHSSESEDNDPASSDNLSPIKSFDANREIHEPISLPSKPQPCPPTVTIPASVISDLTKGINMAHDLLHKERQTTQELWRENTELKLKIKDLEIAARPTFQCHHREAGRTPRDSPATINSVKEDKSTSTLNGNDKAESSLNREDNNNANGHKNSIKAKANNNTKNNPPLTNKIKTTTKRNNNKTQLPSEPTANKDHANQPEMTKVKIIGDSQLRKISGEKLSKDRHSVRVEAMPGARIAQMENVHIEKDTNVIIVHAGTCNIRKQTDPDELSDEIVSTLRAIKSRFPKMQIAFSSILKRTDNLELNSKVLATNKILEEKLLLSGLDFIDNSNLRYGNISFDGLHVNDGGVKMLASNFSKYVRYC